MATLANVGPMFGGVLPVVQHWPTLPLPFTTLGQTFVQCVGLGASCRTTLANIASAIHSIASNIGQCENNQCWPMLGIMFGYIY